MTLRHSGPRPSSALSRTADSEGVSLTGEQSRFVCPWCRCSTFRSRQDARRYTPNSLRSLLPLEKLMRARISFHVGIPSSKMRWDDNICTNTRLLKYTITQLHIDTPTRIFTQTNPRIRHVGSAIALFIGILAKWSPYQQDPETTWAPVNTPNHREYAWVHHSLLTMAAARYHGCGRTIYGIRWGERERWSGQGSYILMTTIRFWTRGFVRSARGLSRCDLIFAVLFSVYGLRWVVEVSVVVWVPLLAPQAPSRCVNNAFWLPIRRN